MKKIKKEIEVAACEICSREIDQGVKPVQVVGREKGKEGILYLFHQECVDKLLIETVKANK